MAITFSYQAHQVAYVKAATTSRGAYVDKQFWVISLKDENGVIGIGECSPLPGLSPDNPELLVATMDRLKGIFATQKISIAELPNISAAYIEDSLPALRFAFESAGDMMYNHGKCYYDSPFTQGLQQLKINGLVWMNDLEAMKNEALAKLKAGFTIIKFKVGAIDFESELALLAWVRSQPNGNKLEIRLDANGAFTPEDALVKLQQLAKFNIHSIEQPIKAGQWHDMARICQQSPIPIALDEELIGVKNRKQRMALLTTIEPQFIVLKPTLLGGLKAAGEWIQLAKTYNIGWWLTSALECNIGLAAIAQYAGLFAPNTVHGLGTGQLFQRNFMAPIKLTGEQMQCNPTIMLGTELA